MAMTTALFALVFTVGLAAQADPFAALAVPEQLLPPGCRLAAAPGSPGTGAAVRAARVGALPIDNNPWRGADRIALAAIRERVDPAQLMPDGPPLHSRDLAAFRSNLADGVEQAYAAIYESEDRTQVGVYAVQFHAESSFEAAIERLKRRQAFLDREARTLAVVTNSGSPCAAAIEAHLKNAFRR
jgi:hypothetical protein